VIARTNRFKKFIDGLTKESKKSELNKFRLRQNFQISDVRDEATLHSRRTTTTAAAGENTSFARSAEISATMQQP
jgi:translation elongation factor EF-Ts